MNRFEDSTKMYWPNADQRSGGMGRGNQPPPVYEAPTGRPLRIIKSTVDGVDISEQPNISPLSPVETPTDTPAPTISPNGNDQPR